MDIELSEEIKSAPQPEQPKSSNGVISMAQAVQPILIDDVQDKPEPQQSSSSSGIKNAAQHKSAIWINDVEVAITENFHANMCIQVANAISVFGKNTLYDQDEYPS